MQDETLIAPSEYSEQVVLAEPKWFGSDLNSHDYDASQIQVLEWLEPVRQRPGMYIWSTDIRGLHHLIQEIVDNAVDEALAGYCRHIHLTLHPDNSVTVSDDGRGIPVDIHPKTGKSALETVYTVLHAGGKFGKSAYKISWWLHGVGASVVNALSERLTVTVHKNGRLYQQSYDRGVPRGPIQEIGTTDRMGTTVHFKPDPQIFETMSFVEHTEVTRMKYGAYLTPGVTFTIVSEISGHEETFCYEGGIRTWLENIAGEQQVVTPQISMTQETEDCAVDLTFKYVDSTNDTILSFVNNIVTKDHGTHVTGFKNALLDVINELTKEKGKADHKIGEFQPSDITDGLYAIVTVKIPEPQFEWQTKGRLGNSNVRKIVQELVYKHLKDYFASNESDFFALLDKIMLSARARLAAKLAKETVLRKNVFANAVLPGKLRDCSNKDRAGTELFIVEGDSAWGSAKQWRDSSFQAILPLRGKILNTEQASIQKIMASEQVKNLILAIGAGMRENYDPDKIRYDKIIIMTDADVDGAHIRTLLLTFFFRYMRPLITNEKLFIAVPPIYKFTQGKKEKYIYPPVDDIASSCAQFGFDPEKVDVQRYKGLGEMNAEDLWITTMDPLNRKLMQVTVDDAEEADKLFRILMGEDVTLRRDFILTNAKNVKELDV